MSKVTLNPVLEAFRGKLGDLVFKRYGEETIVGRKPDPSGHAPTTGQLAVREQFKLAALYGRTALANPATKALYHTAAQAKDIPLFALAVADFFHEPVVEQVDVSSYSGKTGEPIRITASDDFEVVGVGVVVRDSGGAVLEQGPAAKADNDTVWTYTATTNVPTGQSVVIEVTATDRPGHKAVKTATKP